MGIYESDEPSKIRVYENGVLIEKVRLMKFDASKYSDEHAFVGMFGTFCSVNMSTTYRKVTLTLDRIKKYQQEWRDPMLDVEIVLEPIHE